MKLDITLEERDELLRLLESSLSDMRVETRRTDNWDYHKMLHREEDLLRGLIDKLREGEHEDVRLAG